MAKKKRIPIPAAVQAKVQFDADRTCCICRKPGKPFQIHHIDEDPSNNDEKNLAVLCRDCHDETMIRGTFNRRLGPDVVTLYRDDWLGIVALRREEDRNGIEHSVITQTADFGGIVETLEILKDRKEYGFLAMEYDRLGNANLRDKYIDLALEHDASDYTAIFLRGLQGKPEHIPVETLERVIKRQTELKQWFHLAGTYNTIGDYRNSIINYCKGLMDSLAEGNDFASAYHLQELSGLGLHVPLFKETYEQAEAKGNILWAWRSLQQLEWWTEADALLLRNEQRIVESDDHLLMKALYAVNGDVEAYRALDKLEAETIWSDPESGAVGFGEEIAGTDPGDILAK